MEFTGELPQVKDYFPKRDEFSVLLVYTCILTAICLYNLEQYLM